MKASINRVYFYILPGSIEIGLDLVEAVPVACAAWRTWKLILRWI